MLTSILSVCFMFYSEYASKARHTGGINLFGCSPCSAGSWCFLSVWCLHRALCYSLLSRLPWRPIPVETILFPLLYRLLGCNLFALLFFILYGHCLWFGNFEGGAVAWSKLSHRLYFHQHCQVLKIFLLEIHYLVNLAKYMWPIN